MFRTLFRSLVTSPASSSFIRTLARGAGVFIPWDAEIVETSRYSYSKDKRPDGHRAYLSKPAAFRAVTDWKMFVTVQSRHSGSVMITLVAPGGQGVSFLQTAEGAKSIADEMASAAAYASPRTARRMDAVAWPLVEEQARA
jgi:hypothetical protein